LDDWYREMGEEFEWRGEDSWDIVDVRSEGWLNPGTWHTWSSSISTRISGGGWLALAGDSVG